MIPLRFRPLACGKANQAARAAGLEFLDEIWRYPSTAHTFVGVKARGKWFEHSVRGARLDRVTQILSDFPPTECDIYFCPNGFERSNRKAEFALPTRYGWCDIDDADPDGYDPKPNILWETSPGRFQGLWIWSAESPGTIAARYSKAIVYECGGDKNGWSTTKMLRVPGTVNHKPEYAKPVVKLNSYDETPQKLPKSLARFKDESVEKRAHVELLDTSGIDAQSVMRRYERCLTAFERAMMTATFVNYPDRSDAIHAVVSGLVRAGAENREIFSVLFVNPHFLQKHGCNHEMAAREIASARGKAEEGR